VPSQFEKWSLSQRANVANPDRSCIYCQTRAKLADAHLLGLIEPQDIADMALFLASDESRMVTGQICPVDSGVTIS
jgi:NAD(P)-dependent dehydrogenase (short-subunit alcohol dehydrogenase family)